MDTSRTLCLLLVTLAGCDGPTVSNVPERYEFESRFVPGTSSVNHGGQTARHVLIEDLGSYIESLTEQIDSGTFAPSAEGEVTENLEYFFSAPAADRSEDRFRLTTDPLPLQSTYGELSGSAILVEKVAGNDTATDHRDWSTEFEGWSDASIAAHGGGIDSPTSLLRAFFETVEANALDRANGVSRTSPAGEELPVHVTASGLDLGELVPKLLLGALAFSQATDDYLDDDVEGKGLLADNVADEGGYTELEHAWDEGFGYFGASAGFSGDPEAYVRADDADADGRIDLFTEYSFAPANYVIARDRDSAEGARTTYAADVWLALRTGRAIITQAEGPLDASDLAALREQRDIVVAGFEAGLAATLVHYLNEVLALTAGTGALDHETFLELAHVWSEMKGFALAFQFNPRSALSREDFVELNTLLRDAPVLGELGSAEVEEYRADLREARALLGSAFSFDAANLGDDDGMNGW